MFIKNIDRSNYRGTLNEVLTSALPEEGRIDEQAELDSDQFSPFEEEIGELSPLLRNKFQAAFSSYLAKLEGESKKNLEPVTASQISLQQTFRIENQEDLQEVVKHPELISLELVLSCEQALDLHSLQELSQLKELKIRFWDQPFLSNDFQPILQTFSTLPAIGQMEKVQLAFPGDFRISPSLHRSFYPSISHLFELLDGLNTHFPHLKHLQVENLNLKRDQILLEMHPLSTEEKEKLEGVKQLFPHLESLSFTHCFQDLAESFLILKAFKREGLKTLNLNDNFIFHFTSDDLEFLSKWQNLEELKLGNFQIVDQVESTRYWSSDKVPLDFFEKGNFPKLETLDLSTLTLPTLNFSSFAPQMRLLILNQAHLNGCQMDDLAKLLQLEELYLRQVSFSQEQLEQMTFSSLSRLEILDLEGSKVKGLPFDTFAPHLHILNLSKTDVSGGDIKKLASLNQLEELNLSGTKLSSSVFYHLSKLFHLKSLNLSQTSLRDGNFELLSKLPDLRELDLSGVNLSVADLKKLAKLTQLEVLNLKGLTNALITQEHLATLQKELADCQILY